MWGHLPAALAIEVEAECVLACACPAGVALGKCVEYGYEFANKVAAQTKKAAASAQ
jgi:hypothetical protein